MKICFLSIDVEKREENGSFEGTEKLDNILNIFRKHRANATLFVTGEVLEKYPYLVKKWEEDYEISCHNYYHVPLDRLGLIEREKQVVDFIGLYKNNFNGPPRGFRAPRNIVDNEQFSILEKYGFLYDASVFPRYPWWKKRYAGFRGKSPVKPYFPDMENYKKPGRRKIFEIPESGLAFSVPFVGTWIRGLGVLIYKMLLFFKKPEFICFNMHSWDGVKFKGKSSKNSGEKYLKQLDKILGHLKKIGYEFKTGEQIYEEFSENK